MGTISCLLVLGLAWGAPPAAADQDITFLYGPEKGKKEPNYAQFLNRHFTLLEHAMMDLVMIGYSRDLQTDQFMVAWYLKDCKPGDPQKEEEMVKKLLRYYQPSGDPKRLEEALRQLVRNYKPTGDEDKDREAAAKLMANFSAKDKSGYFFDREAKYKAADDGYQKAIGLLKKQVEDREKAKQTDKPFDPVPALEFAARMRSSAFHEIASGYLKDTDGGKGDPLKLGLFESDLLFSYLKWVPNVEDVMREWLKVVIPESPEDRYLQELRITNSRALLRSEMKRYLASPPSGIQDPDRQYAEVARLAQALLQNDRQELDAIYASAGMKVPVKPAPKSTAHNPQAKPFVYQFTDQEHAVLTYLILAPESPLAKEFAEDQKKADSPDADAALAASLLAKWRERVKGQAILSLEPEERRAETAQNPDRLTIFESTYVEWRLERIDPRMRDQLKRLGEEAQQEEKNGDPEAQQRLVGHLRGLIARDLETYVQSDGKASDTALKDWAGEALKSETSFARLFPKPSIEEASLPMPPPPRQPESPSQNGDVGAVYEALFENPVERAMAEYIVSISTDKADQEARLAETANMAHEDPERKNRVLDLRKRAAAAVRDQLTNPQPSVEAFLAGKGIVRDQLLDYCCPLLAALPASDSDPEALLELKALAQQVDPSVRAVSLEEAKTLVEVEPSGALADECLGRYGAKKKNDVVGKSQKEFKPTLTLAKSSETVPSPKDEKKKGETGKKSSLGAKAVAMALTGAALGWAIAGLFGALLGLGPVALIGLALYGAAAGAWIARSASKQGDAT